MILFIATMLSILKPHRINTVPIVSLSANCQNNQLNVSLESLLSDTFSLIK